MRLWLVSSDLGVIQSGKIVYEKLYGASFYRGNVEIINPLDYEENEYLLLSLTSDRLYVFTMFMCDEVVWNHMLRILSHSQYFEAHLLIQSSYEWLEYAEVFSHLIKKLSEGVEYVTWDFHTSRIGMLPIIHTVPRRQRVSLPIWKTVGPAMARNVQEKIHASPHIMSLGILLIGEARENMSIMNSLNSVITSWRSGWDYGAFVPCNNVDLRGLREAGFNINKTIVDKVKVGVWRRFLLREFKIGWKTWEILSTLQGQFIDFYHPLPMTLDEIHAFLKLPNDLSLPIRYKRERRVEVYAPLEDGEEGFEIGRVM